MTIILRSVLLMLALMAGGAAQAQDFDYADEATAEAAEGGNGAETRGELCRNACDRDFAICSDEGSAGRDTLSGRTGATAGVAQIDGVRCQNDLQECMKGCKGL